MTLLRRAPRRLIQLTCFVGAVVLIWPLLPWAIAPRFFQQVSPFVAISSGIAARSIGVGVIFALVVAVVSSFKKRWFCLYLCPTGFLLENANHIGLRKSSLWSKCPPIGRYVAILTIVGSIAGYPVLLWMDPLCIFSSPFAVNRATNPISVFLVSIGLGALVGATFIFGMLWCVRICPLSGLQDMLYLGRKALWSKFSVRAPTRVARDSSPDVTLAEIGRASAKRVPGGPGFSPDVTLAEIEGASAAGVPASRRESATRRANFAEWSLGGRSFSSDNKPPEITGALAPEVRTPRAKSSFFARRAFFAGAGGAVLALLARRAGAARFRKSDTLLRPPGAVPEDRFAGLCIRCNNCVHACPTKIIHPDTGHEGGLAGFAAPVVKFDRDYKYCLETCNACTEVCPTGALTALPLAQKNKYIIGEALVDNNICLTALGKKECDACEQACPYDAVKITWDEQQYNAYPVVNDKCIGCGACEVVCPTSPVRSIRVWTQKPA